MDQVNSSNTFWFVFDIRRTYLSDFYNEYKILHVFLEKLLSLIQDEKLSEVKILIISDRNAPLWLMPMIWIIQIL